MVAAPLGDIAVTGSETPGRGGASQRFELPIVELDLCSSHVVRAISRTFMTAVYPRFEFFASLDL